MHKNRCITINNFSTDLFFLLQFTVTC